MPNSFGICFCKNWEDQGVKVTELSESWPGMRLSFSDPKCQFNWEEIWPFLKTQWKTAKETKTVRPRVDSDTISNQIIKVLCSSTYQTKHHNLRTSYRNIMTSKSGTIWVSFEIKLDCNSYHHLDVPDFVKCDWSVVEVLDLQ